VDWIDRAQDMGQWRALVNTVLNLRVPWNAGKFLSGCPINGSSRRAQLRELKEKRLILCSYYIFMEKSEDATAQSIQSTKFRPNSPEINQSYCYVCGTKLNRYCTKDRENIFSLCNKELKTCCFHTTRSTNEQCRLRP
jgi:hypothetical protein